MLKSDFLDPLAYTYTFLSISFFLSFFLFLKTHKYSCRPGVALDYMKRSRIRKQVTLCCFQSNVSSLQWLQLHQLLLLQYHSQQLLPCQLYQRTAWIVSSFQSSNKRCISISWIERALDSKPPSKLHFSLPSIIITITSNEPWNTETRETDRNPSITNHKPWTFETVKVLFPERSIKILTAAKNAIVSWLLNFTIHMFVKIAVKLG